MVARVVLVSGSKAIRSYMYVTLSVPEFNFEKNNYLYLYPYIFVFFGNSVYFCQHPISACSLVGFNMTSSRGSPHATLPPCIFYQWILKITIFVPYFRAASFNKFSRPSCFKLRHTNVLTCPTENTKQLLPLETAAIFTCVQTGVWNLKTKQLGFPCDQVISIVAVNLMMAGRLSLATILSLLTSYLLENRKSRIWMHVMCLA